MTDNYIVPPAAPKLDDFTYEVASELGYGTIVGQPVVTAQNFKPITGTMKYEIANELGIAPKIQDGYWGNISSRECGAVGGRIGGKIGGNMVRKMIAFAEQNISR